MSGVSGRKMAEEEGPGFDAVAELPVELFNGVGSALLSTGPDAGG